MERRRFSDCIIKAAEELGYPTMKMEQLDVAKHSPTCMACGRFCHFGTVVVNHRIITKMCIYNIMIFTAYIT